MPDPLYFRPHHFLCALGFQGKGYSDAFTDNMAALVDGKLRAEGGGEIAVEVTAMTDSICAPCPHRSGVLCKSQDRIAALDRRHARALKLAPGDRLLWAEALERIRENVAPGDLSRLCAGCQWLEGGMCEAALVALHAEEPEKHGPVGGRS